MTEVLAFLSANMLAVLIGLAVLALLVVGWLVWVLRRARTGEEEGDGTEAEMSAPVAALTQAADLELSFRRGLKNLKAISTGPAPRYRMPWYLALGPTDAGTSAMLDGVPLPRRVQPADADAPVSRACRWHFYDGGLVLDIAGALVLKRDGSHDEVGWRRLLSLLKRYRPERPIDGVVLTLSAEDLHAWRDRPADELREVGAGLYARFRQLQNELGVRFPVYVVLTKADRLPGFSSFVAAVPRRFHQDAFGWSSPYPVDAAFRGEWVDEAMEALEGELRERTTEVLASRDLLAEADAVFRFPEVAAELIPATRVILSEMFSESAYHERFFLRGIYLSGRVDPELTPVSLADPTDDDAEQETGGAVFLSRLFQKKIFPEGGLARGFARGILDRNRTVRWLQIASVVLVLVGIPGLWYAHSYLDRDAIELRVLLTSVHDDLRTITGPASDTLTQQERERVVRSLLQQMANANAGPFWSVFLPSSWFSELPDQLTSNMTAGFQEVILPTLRRGIREWPDTMTNREWAVDIGGRVPPEASDTTQSTFWEYQALVRYLSELRQFAQNAHRFNQFSPGGEEKMQAFADLFAWYYEAALPQAFFQNHAFYSQALESAEQPPVSGTLWPGFEERSASVAVFLADRFYARVRDAVVGLDASFAGTLDPAFGPDDLRQLALDVGQVHDLLTSADSAWFDSNAPMVPTLVVMLDSLPDRDLAELFDRAAFIPRFSRGFDEVRAQQLAGLSRELDVLSQSLSQASGFQGGTRLDLAPRLASLRAALGDLLARDFMAPVTTTAPPTRPALAGRPVWALPPLDEGLSYFGEYDAFRTDALDGVPAELRGLVLNVAARSLEERVREALSRAMTYEVGVEAEGRAGRAADLSKRLASFDAAARRLVGMLEVDAELGGTAAGDAVAEAIILEGSDLLNQVDLLLAEAGLYRPVNGNFAVWQADRPASLAGFGAAGPAELEAYLAQQRTVLRSLSGYAGQVLSYFALAPVADLLRTEGATLVPNTPELVRTWRGIVRTLDDYENKVPGNALEGLEQYIRQDLDVRSLSGCPSGPAPATGAARDWFEAVQARLQRLLLDQCRQIARQAFLADYRTLTDYFAENVAGRFPFADLQFQPDAPDADVESVRGLLERYDAVAATLAADDASVVEGLLGGAVSADFLLRMSRVRSLLGPLLTMAEGEPPGGLTFRVQLRTRTDVERGADQIVDWRLSVDGQTVTYRGAGTSGSGRWRSGQDVSMALVWASESLRRPVGDPERADLGVDAETARWRYEGPWALLRLVEANRPVPAELTGAVEDRTTVNLRTFTRSRDAAAEVEGGRGVEASVFLRLDFAATPESVTLTYPRFPTRPPGATR
ncbi:MAG: type VI secretion protein IcmF/TssM N-terminal domain-containing protein [Longimicrobiales bacterium]